MGQPSLVYVRNRVVRLSRSGYRCVILVVGVGVRSRCSLTINVLSVCIEFVSYLVRILV